jgi:hypothetical protein
MCQPNGWAAPAGGRSRVAQAARATARRSAPHVIAVDLQVDEPGGDDRPAGVDHARSRRGYVADGRDAPVGDRQVSRDRAVRRQELAAPDGQGHAWARRRAASTAPRAPSGTPAGAGT